MLRTILRQSFGRESYSIYDDKTDIAKNPAVGALIGHRMMGMKAPEFIRRSTASPDVRFVKTHSPPVDDAPAIYVVRDGRAAVISYYRYLRDVRDRTDVQLRDVIEGNEVYFSNWSGSVREWNPQTRSRTLLLRYEDLVRDVATAIERIERFTGLQPVSEWQNEFESMQSLYPEFFRVGSNQKNIEALQGSDADLFWSLHGDTMEAMRYPGRPKS